jgi:hypothetical protein
MSVESFEKEPIRIFIGSSAKNLIEEKVLCYTLKKYTTSPLDIYIIDGQNGSAKSLLTGELKTLPPDIVGRIPGATAFSLARWAIPQWCDYRGKALYCDSDQIALADVAELWNFELEGSACAAVPVKQAKCYKHYLDQVLRNFLLSDDEHYLASVMLFDCEQALVWNLESLIKFIDQKKFSFPNLMFLSAPFRRYFNITVKALPSEWNHLDIVDAESKIVHFTDLTSQPWRFHHHSISDVWEQYFLETIDRGELTIAEVQAAGRAGYISVRVKSLPLLPSTVRVPINQIWRFWGASIFRGARFLSGRVKDLLSVGRKLRTQVKRLTSAHP